MEIEHQMFNNPSPSLVHPPLPPRVPPPPQPSVLTTPPDMDVDHNDCMSIYKRFVPIYSSISLYLFIH